MLIILTHSFTLRDHDHLTITVSGRCQSFRVSIPDLSLRAASVFAVSTVGADMQPLELGTISGLIDMSLLKREVSVGEGIMAVSLYLASSWSHLI